MTLFRAVLAPLASLALLTCSLAPTSARGDPVASPVAKVDASWQDEVSTFINAKMDARQSVGLSIAISTPELTWSQGYGYRQLSPKKKATAKTVYRMASVTKMWTATAIMQLAERGKLSLDAPVQRYLPDYPHRGAKITLRRLLGHLSGISHYRDKSGPEGHITTPMTTAESLAIFKDWPLVAKPGDKFIYTSYGFNVLGAVVEAVSGMSFGAYLERYIFKRAKMKSSGMAVEAARPAAQAVGYRIVAGRIVRSEFIDISSRFGGGGTISTVTDMARYGRAMIAGRLVRPRSFQKMQRSMFTNDGKLTDYGAGMATYSLLGRPIIAHSGSQPETSTLLIMYPADGLVVALASNLEHQSDLLWSIAGFVGERLLTDGLKRRPLAGSDKGTAVLARALGTSFGHGLAAHRRGHTFDHDGASPLIFGFQSLRGYLQDPVPSDEEAVENLALNLGPKKREAFVRVGAHMAGVLASAKGEAALLPYHVSGALPFFRDYIAVCEQRDCPVPFRFSPEETERLLAWASQWDVAYSEEVRTFSITEATTVEHAADVLNRNLAGAPLKPSFVSDIMERYESALRAKDIDEAEKWAELAFAHFAQEPKVHIAWAEVSAERQTPNAPTVDGAAELIGGEKRLSVGRLKYRALTLRNWGFERASLASLEGAARVHPDVAHVWDALSRQQERVGDPQAALLSAEMALSKKRSQRRRNRIAALKKKLAG